MDTVIYDIKSKETSGNSSCWYQGIPCFQYDVLSDSPPPTSNHKSGGKSQRSLKLNYKQTNIDSARLLCEMGESPEDNGPSALAYCGRIL